MQDCEYEAQQSSGITRYDDICLELRQQYSHYCYLLLAFKAIFLLEKRAYHKSGFWLIKVYKWGIGNCEAFTRIGLTPCHIAKSWVKLAEHSILLFTVIL